MTAQMRGKIAVVTGAASGIGAATAIALSTAGASVVLADRDIDGLDSVAVPGPALRVGCDITVLQDIERLLERTMASFGRVDLFVANAGIHQRCDFLDISVDDWDRMIGTNLRGTFLGCQSFARAMAASGGGTIVVMCSTNGFMAEASMAHYNVSKGGLAMLVRSMAVDLARFGIRTVGIAPGTMRTPMTEEELARGEASGLKTPPLGRWGTAEECADLVAFLGSPAAGYINGEIVVIDGGQTVLNGDIP